MRVLLDAIIESDLCLPDGAEPLKLRFDSDDVDVAISNAPGSSPATSALLAVRLVFTAEVLLGAREIAIEKLTRVMNCLAYASNRRFSLKRVLKLIEWTPGVVDRVAHIYVESPVDDRAQPELHAGFISTTERLLAAQTSPAQARALRWYRLAIQSEDINEQFSYFWFALEIAAQTLKSPDRVSSKCPHCRGDLYCQSCARHPLHRPYPGEAIRQVIERVHPDDSDTVFGTLQTVRHALMHGDSIDAVRDKLPCTDEQAVNKLANISWQALSLMFEPIEDLYGKPLEFGMPETFVRHTLVASMEITTRLTGGDPNDPNIQNFPDIQFTVELGPPKASTVIV